MPSFIIHPDLDFDPTPTLTILPNHVCQLVREEFDILSAIHDKDFSVRSLTPESIHVQYTRYPLTLSLMIPKVFEPIRETLTKPIIQVRGDSVSRLLMFELEDRIRAISQDSSQKNIIDVDDQDDAPQQALINLLSDLIEDVRSFTQDYFEDDLEAYEGEFEGDFSEISNDLVISDAIRDDRTISGYLGSFTPARIQQMIGNRFKILHSEVILRDSLIRQFEKYRRTLEIKHRLSRLSRRTADIVADRLLKEEIVFHGTLRKNVASIVANGFVVPGQMVHGEEHQVRCGSTWGRGIYTSPDPLYSFSYSDHTVANARRLPGLKLIVAACLMGKRYQLKEGEYQRNSTKALNDFDSNVSPYQKEYVVFHGHQILPILVLHIDYADSNKVPENSVSATKIDVPDLCNLRVDTMKERRAILTAHARGRLPFGFGPKGVNFVVEEIGGVDEDDEQYGEYQDLMHITNHLDEFHLARVRGLVEETDRIGGSIM